MKSAFGVLKWTPPVFWKATFYEYTAAMVGHLESQGVSMESKCMDRNGFLELKAQAKAKGLI